MPELLSLGMAVFNGHVNNADQRARTLMRAITPKLLAEVESLEQAEYGIMAIFNHEPTTATSVYSAMVTAYANEGRLSSTPPINEDEKRDATN